MPSTSRTSRSRKLRTPCCRTLPQARMLRRTLEAGRALEAEVAATLVWATLRVTEARSRLTVTE